MQRCEWATTELLQAYHDTEWGVPVHDERTLFEFLVLEGAQAGLSWELILKKRAQYRRAFDNFDVRAIAGYDEREVEQLLTDPGIVRNRRKVMATIDNAQAFLVVQQEFGSFAAYVWLFVGNRTIQNRWQSLGEIPARTPESDALSKDLRRRRFAFVGPTICYAFMQAVGMVNDHIVECFRYDQLQAAFGSADASLPGSDRAPSGL